MATVKLKGRTLKAERAEIVFAGSGLSQEIVAAEEVAGGLIVHTKHEQKGQPRRSYILPWGAVWRLTLDNPKK